MTRIWKRLCVFAQWNSTRNVKTIAHGLEPIFGGRSVLLHFTAEQFDTFAAAIVAHGAIKKGAGFIDKGKALIATIEKNIT